MEKHGCTANIPCFVVTSKMEIFFKIKRWPLEVSVKASLKKSVRFEIRGGLKLFIVSSFREIPCFKRQDNRKTMSTFTGGVYI